MRKQYLKRPDIIMPAIKATDEQREASAWTGTSLFYMPYNT